MANIAKKPFSFLKRKVSKITGRITKEEFWALKDIDFDVFKGEKIGENKKSISFNVIFGNFTETPKSEDIEKIWKKILKDLEKEFKAVLR